MNDSEAKLMKNSEADKVGNQEVLDVYELTSFRI